ncbi:MAG: type VI secretion system baseplate subunit TssK [SAR324 cluster bacterium]|nr:type VI secretion system baseplate subunit TssK [SAR324 cluster bacterium]
MEVENTASLKPIFWHQGQFLQPQHLQHTDLYHESHLSTLLRIANPFFYGVVLLDVNEGALESDVFEVENGEILLKDGTFVDCPDDAVLLPRSFTSAWIDRHQPLKIYVGIRKMNPAGGNVTVITDPNDQELIAKVSTRYLTPAEPTTVPSYHVDGPVAKLQHLSYVVRLFWENEIEEAAKNYDLLEIAQIVSDGGTTKMSPTYVPPCVHIASSQLLVKTLKEIRDELAGRIRQLEDYKTPAGASTQVDGRTVNFKMTIQLLSQYVPILFHYVDTPSVHPWVIYGLLRQLIGGISTLSDKINFLGETTQGDRLLPPYMHNRLESCFQSAQKLIIQVLNEITISSETIVRLEQVGTGQFRADLSKALFGASNIYISMITSENFEQMFEQFAKYAKIGSEEQVKIYVERSLAGLEVKYLTAQPEGVPRRPNASYLRVDRQHPAWEGIVNQGNIKLIWDDAPEDLKVDFIAV